MFILEIREFPTFRFSITQKSYKRDTNLKKNSSNYKYCIEQHLNHLYPSDFGQNYVISFENKESHYMRLRHVKSMISLMCEADWFHIDVKTETLHSILRRQQEMS